MRRRLAGLVLALLAVPPAFAAVVFGWSALFTGRYAARGDLISAGGGWGLAAELAAQSIGIAIALFLIGRGAVRAKYRVALIALAVAWLLALPEFTAIRE